MRTITLLFSALVLGTAACAQTVATFDDQVLPTADTYYVNYAMPGMDVGFDDGHAHFPCIYDTAFGGTWNYFAYSNKTDSVTSGYANQYSAKAGIGYGGSAEYAVAYCGNPITYADNMYVKMIGAAINKPVAGFYVTNSTLTYNSMLNGGPYSAKKFGGPTGNDPDWLLLTVYGYSGGIRSADSVNFYLADFRFADNDSDYLIKTWEWVNLLPLGNLDSVVFQLNSSDTAGGLGMNTPSYLCIDNFTTNAGSLGVQNAQPSYLAKVYPNPAKNVLYVDVTENSVEQVAIADMAGNVVSTFNASTKHIEINTSTLPAGMYLLQLTDGGKTATTKFVKQ